MAPIQPIRVVFGSKRCASSPRLTLAGYDLIWQAQCCHLEFVQFEILINELGATLCFCRCHRRFSSSSSPFSGQFVFYLPFLYPSSSQSSSKGNYRGLRWLWGEILVSHHSRWYQWLWVTQLEGLCGFSTRVCLVHSVERGWSDGCCLLMLMGWGWMVLLSFQIFAQSLFIRRTLFSSCLHTNSEHKTTTTILISHPTGSKGTVEFFEEFPCILLTKQQ